MCRVFDARGKESLYSSTPTWGLWLLSAIFISGLGTVYRYHEDERQHARALADKAFDEKQLRLAKELDAQAVRKSAISHLDSEISYRFSRLLIDLQRVQLRGHLDEANKSGLALNNAATNHFEQALAAIRKTLGPPDEPADILYIENANKSLPALLAELDAVVESPDEHHTIEAAHRKLLQMVDQPIHLVATGAPHGKDYAARIHEECLLPRWRRQGFAFTMCSSTKPFCGPETSTKATVK